LQWRLLIASSQHSNKALLHHTKLKLAAAPEPFILELQDIQRTLCNGQRTGLGCQITFRSISVDADVIIHNLEWLVGDSEMNKTMMLPSMSMTASSS